MNDGPIYLDCAATTRVEPLVAQVAMSAMVDEYGNAGSRTHQFGSRAKELVEQARAKIAQSAGCDPEEVIFTSGATEADNIALLGFQDYGLKHGKCHIVSTAIEHKAVLEPLAQLEARGFEVTLVAPDVSGRVSPSDISNAIRDDTLLVSVMQVNNETGIIQPIAAIADELASSEVFFHVDAAQGFTKDLSLVGLERVDLMSLSGHKIGAPKGIGVLVARSRGMERLPITSLTFGGGQERGIRPGTLPVHLAAAFGAAAELGRTHFEQWNSANLDFRQGLIEALEQLNPTYLGDQSASIPNIISFAIRGIDSEAFMLVTKDLIAISNGSACTSHRYEPSHVLVAMGIDIDLRQSAVRISWSHDSETPDWNQVVSRLTAL
jgi:cysteine desulfurase